MPLNKETKSSISLTLGLITIAQRDDIAEHLFLLENNNKSWNI